MTDSAAINLDWGTPTAGDEFNYTGAPDPSKWSVYKSAGHAGNGIRSPQQVTVDGWAAASGLAGPLTWA
jgi:hypothetical protein